MSYIVSKINSRGVKEYLTVVPGIGPSFYEQGFPKMYWWDQDIKKANPFETRKDAKNVLKTKYSMSQFSFHPV